MPRAGAVALAAAGAVTYNQSVITDILRPATARDAVRAKSVPGSAFLGGGTWLNSGRARGTSVLISLDRLGLDRIEPAQAGCAIGAKVTFQGIVDASAVPPALRAAALLTASRTLRNMVTLGGELGLAPDDSAVIPVLMVLGATVQLASRRRPIPIEDLLNKPGGDLILSVAIPDTRLPCAVRALSRTSHSPRSLVVAACAAPGRHPDARREVRVVLCDCVGQRARLLEEGTVGSPMPDRQRLEALVGSVFSPGPDLHASVEYKRHMAGVLVADVVQALAAAGGAG